MIIDMGRPKKGERDRIMARPADDFGKIIRQVAQERGYYPGDFLVMLAAHHFNLPQFAPQPERPLATELDIPEEAHRKAA